MIPYINILLRFGRGNWLMVQASADRRYLQSLIRSQSGRWSANSGIGVSSRAVTGD